MTWLGRYQVGDFVPLVLQSTTTAGVAVTPTVAAVTAKLYNASGVLVTTISLGLNNKVQTVGLFRSRWLATAVGVWMVVYDWSDGTAQKKVERFEVVAGGSSSGAVVALHATELPEATYLLLQGANGTLYYGRNPY